MITILGALFFSLLVFLSTPERIVSFFLSILPILKSMQVLLLCAAPLYYVLLGRYWLSSYMAPSAPNQINLFLVWYNKRKKIYLLGVYLLIALSFFCSYILDFSSLKTSWPVLQFVPSILSWVCILLSLDYLFFSFQSIENHMAPEKAFILVQSQIRHAAKKGDIRSVLAYYELIFALMNDFFKTFDPLLVQVVEKEMINTIELVLELLPKLTLYQKTGETGTTLLDQVVFLVSLTARRLSLLLRGMMHMYNKTEDMPLYSSALFSVTVRLFLLFQERYSHDKYVQDQFSDLGYTVLQSAYSVVIDSMKKKENKPYTENPITEFASALSECIKILIDQLAHGQSLALDTIQRLLNMLESLMKELFRLNRSINPVFLMQPFAEIGQYIGEVQFQNSGEREVLLSKLKQILSQFAVLETVTERLDIQGMKTDTEASYKEDIPFQNG